MKSDGIMENMYGTDKMRGGELPVYQYLYRKLRATPEGGVMRKVYKLLFRMASFAYHSEISAECVIGKGLYIGHPYCITINPKAIIGDNCNIHKGVTVGQENRGGRKGAPVIGDRVWMGVNCTIVGAVRIGNDVLIAPNSYVNRDVPDHSVVFGNPCVIKSVSNATEGYINRAV